MGGALEQSCALRETYLEPSLRAHGEGILSILQLPPPWNEAIHEISSWGDLLARSLNARRIAENRGEEPLTMNTIS